MHSINLHITGRKLYFQSIDYRVVVPTEYEGSPRRIGQCIIEEEDKIECITSPDRRNYKLYHTSVTTPRLDASPPAVHLPLSARPGFPQVKLILHFHQQVLLKGILV